jgi:hypothetical protein
MNEDKLDKLLQEMIELKTDMSYVKKHIEATSNDSVRLAIVENKINALNSIAWKIGSACGTAILMALLALIL